MAVFSGLYHPTDMSMLQNMLKQQQQQRQFGQKQELAEQQFESCLLYTSPSPRDRQKSRMPSSA